MAGLAPGVKKLRGGARERSLSFIFVLITVRRHGTVHHFASVHIDLRCRVEGREPIVAIEARVLQCAVSKAGFLFSALKCEEECVPGPDLIEDLR